MSMIYLVGNGYVSGYISQIKIENKKEDDINKNRSRKIFKKKKFRKKFYKKKTK